MTPNLNLWFNRYMATTTPTDTFTGMACIDCTMLIANGEAPEHLGEDEAAAWLANFSERNEGIYWAVGDYEDDFSSVSCTTCGSTLGGSRNEIVGWGV